MSKWQVLSGKVWEADSNPGNPPSKPSVVRLLRHKESTIENMGILSSVLSSCLSFWRPVRGRWSCSSQAAILQDVFEWYALSGLLSFARCYKNVASTEKTLSTCVYWCWHHFLWGRVTCAALQRDLVALALVVFVFLFAFLDWMDTSSLSAGYWLDGQIFMKLSGETQNTLPVFSFASLNTSWLEKDGNCMKLQIALAKGLVVERHWPLQCHTFPCPGQTRWETPFFAVRRPLQCQAWAARGFSKQPCASPRFVAMGAYKASCNVLQLSKIQNTSMHILISCRQFLQVHLWQGAGHADSRGALCFGVLAASHMLFHIQLTQ